MPTDDAVRFDYQGPAAWREPIAAALRGVVDSELALSIVDLGLVYGVDATADAVTVRLTMTSAACPVADLVLDDVAQALDAVLPPAVTITPQLVWEPAWGPERLSPRARQHLGW